MARGAPTTRTGGDEPPEAASAPAPGVRVEHRGSPDRRRFVVAVVVAQLIAAIPYAWAQFSSWGPWSVTRKTAFEDNFYDVQARAMLHGHLNIPIGSIGIEGFIHGGREYTYFGLFPSIVRMPVLLITHSLDSKLTPLAMVTAWALIGIFCSLLVWRVRILIRGRAALSVAEAVGYGALVATVLCGSVLVYLAATPYTFDEDLTWSVALALGSFFALLGVVERPSRGRVLAAGVLVLAANLNRSTTGAACDLAALIVAWWFFTGRGGDENRRWWAPALLVGGVPFLIACLVNLLKFGVPFGLPITEQIWSHINQHRKLFLRVNHNMEYGPQFAPATTLAYWRPDGIRLSSVFPFVTLPASPEPSAFGVIFDGRNRTASVPASMPMLTLLACGGVYTVLRRGTTRGMRICRLMFVPAAAAGAALLFWGFIANRYLADFVPFLVMAGVVACVHLWSLPRMVVRGRRRTVAVLLVIGAVVSVGMNMGIASEPTIESSQSQVLAFVNAEKAVSDITGHPLSGSVVRVQDLPRTAPAGRLAIAGNCQGMYLSTGELPNADPAQRYANTNWLVVQRGSAFQTVFRVTFGRLPVPGASSADLVRTPSGPISFSITPAQHRNVLDVDFRYDAGSFGRAEHSVVVNTGSTHTVRVVTDRVQHQATLSLDGRILWGGPMARGADVAAVPPGVSRTVAGTVMVNVSKAMKPPALCASLLREATKS